MGSRSSRSRWEKNQSHKPTTSWPNLQVRTCKIQAKLDSKLGPSVAINIQNQINQTKPYQTKPNQTKPKDLRMSYFCDLLLYSKLQILSLCENVFFSVEPKPNQTKPNHTKLNQTKPKHLGLSYPCELLVYTKFQIPWVS